MAIFGNNIKNPFSTDHPHDENKKPMSDYKGLKDFMSPKKYAEGGMVDPNAPAKPFGDIPMGLPPSERLQQPAPIQNAPAPEEQSSVQNQQVNTLEPQRFAQGGVVGRATTDNRPLDNSVINIGKGNRSGSIERVSNPLLKLGNQEVRALPAKEPQRAVARPWQRNQSAGGSRSQAMQRPMGVQPRRFAEGGMVEGDEEYNRSMDAARQNKVKEQIDNMILQKKVDQELQDKFPIQDKPDLMQEELPRYADGGMVQPGQPGQVDPNARKHKTGTGFVNLQKMMGASSGKKLGEAISGGITGGAEQVKGQLGQEKEQFGKELGEASSVFDPKKRAEAIESASKSGTVSDEQSKAFEGYRAGKLGAPDLSGGLKGYQDLSSKASDVAQQAKDVESQAGRYNLLQRYASGGKQYNPGAKRLDAMLLGQKGGQQLQQARMSAGGIGSQLKQAQEGAQAQYGVAAGQARQFGEETEAQLKGATGGVEKEVDFPAQQKALQAKFQQIQSLKDQRPDAAFESTHPGAQAEYDKAQQAGAEQLGIAGEFTYGMDPTELAQYASYDPSKAATASQFASKEQNARMNALMKLSGKDASQSNWGTAAGGEASQALKVGKESLAAKLAEKKAGEEGVVAGEKQSLQDLENWGVDTAQQITRDEDTAEQEFMTANPPPAPMIGGDEYNPPQPNPEYEQQMAAYNQQKQDARANARYTTHKWHGNRALFDERMKTGREQNAAAQAALLSKYRGNTFGKKV